jgi:two-component system sensor histidine kinase UhpB
LKARSLLVQVLAVNLLLIAGAALLGAVSVNANGDSILRGREALVVGMALLATVLGNWLILHRRFKPLDDLISTMEDIDLSAPARRDTARPTDASEVRRLRAAFDRMISRLESERRDAGRAAIGAQEQERRRIAQDLHDEVNQALTAVSLRLQASIEQAPAGLQPELLETKRLCSQAMDELLALTRQLRPPVLDDHGLLPALHSQVRDFGERTKILAAFTTQGTPRVLTPEEQLVVYRVTQESLSNVAQHARARTAHVELSFNGATRLTVRDDGHGFDSGTTSKRNGGHGVTGMRERALLIGARLSIRSRPGDGTTVELRLPQ